MDTIKTRKIMYQNKKKDALKESSNMLGHDKKKL